MKRGYIAALAMLFALLSGCSSLAVRDMVATTPEVTRLRAENIKTEGIDCSAEQIGKQELTDDCHFEVFFEALTSDLSSNDVLSRETSNKVAGLLGDKIKDDRKHVNSIANQLILSPVVQRMSRYIYSLDIKKRSRSRSEVTDSLPTDLKISARELAAFGRLLSDNSGELLRELESDNRREQLGQLDGKTAGVSRLSFYSSNKSLQDFEKVLHAYLKEYASGRFVDRLGNNISKPNLSLSGISDDDIQGITTVFFEALFDSWFSDVPVFYRINNKVEPKYKPDPKSHPDPCDETSSDPCLPQKYKLEEIKLENYQRIYFDEYITNGGGEPTAIKFARVEQIGERDDEISMKDIEKIQRSSKLAGKLSRSLTGLAFGFLNNVNVSFIIGADFAVGDSKTLMHLAQTLAEVWSRRVAEYAAWNELSKR